MAKAGRTGRKARHYKTDSGDTITGLIKQRDGRWRILATGERYSASSESEAIARFHLKTKRELVAVPSKTRTEFDERGGIWLHSETPGEAFWPWLRELLITDLRTVAEKTGLRGLRLDHAPGKAIAIKAVRDLYDQHSDSNWRTKGQVRAALNRLAKVTGTETLEELTTQRLIEFRDLLNAELVLQRYV